MPKVIPFIVLIAFSFSALADNHENSWRGVDLDQQFGIQFEVCSLLPGKSMTDMAKLDGDVRIQFDENTQGLSLMRLTPLFSPGMPGNSQVDFIDVTLGPITDFGSSWDKWMSSEDAQRLMSKIDDVAECTFKFARAKNRVAKTDALDATDSRLVSMEWCSKRENIQWSQIIEQHDEWEASYGESGPAMAWNVVIPRLGSGDRRGQFMHMVSYENATQLMANEEWIANGGGAAALGNYYDAFANCDGESVWSAEYIYRNES